MANGKTFKILSLDGGGIRGLYSAIIIDKFESKYGPISEYFDMICGTSTGGLIALALSIGKPAHEIVNFYQTWGPKIFPSQNLITRFTYGLKWVFFSSKYSNKVLKEALISMFDKKVLNDSRCCICIPAVNLISSTGIVFKTSHNKDFFRDGNIKMVDVALATSAAPTFFPIAKVEPVSSLIVDGGIFANNPSLIGAVEASSYFVGEEKEYSSFSILSIGCLSTGPQWKVTNIRNASILKWGKPLIPLIMQVQSNAMNDILNIAFKNKLFCLGTYTRIPDPQITPEKYKVLGLDRADNEALETIKNLALVQGDRWVSKDEVKFFFQEKTIRRNFSSTYQKMEE